MFRPHALLALVLLGAGCVGATVDRAADAPDPAALAAPLLEAVAEWRHPGGDGRVALGEPLAVPAGAAALFVRFDATLQPGPMAALQLLAVAPDGTETVVGRVGGAVVGTAPRTGSGWTILEAQPGEWSFVGVSRTASNGTLDVAVVAKPPVAERVQGTGADRVVVAVVDTGVNPYHDVFQRPGLDATGLPARVVEAESGLSPLPVRLQRGGDYASSVRADAGLWATLPTDTLVHFEGTNLLGYRLGEATLPAIPILDRAGHGTAVAHAVTNENPDVLVLMLTASDYDEAVRWAATQPWIDLLSLSWGPPVNAMGPAFETVFGTVTPEATRAANDAGKVVFGASGNDPTPTFTDTTSGPIWVHAVSGSEADEHARALMSGNFVDTVANWTQTLALHQSLDETRSTAGTSFATPTTAGVASRILHEVRERAGHAGGIVDGALVNAGGVVLVNKDLRDALNATAVYWSTTQYGGRGSVPVAPAPWMSMGWGHVDGSIVAPAVDALLGVAPAPEKPAAAKAWMGAWADMRDDSWGG